MKKTIDSRLEAYAEFGRYFAELTAAVGNEDKDKELLYIIAAINSLEQVKLAVAKDRGGMTN